MTYLGRGEATEGFVDSVKSFLDKIIKTIKAAISHAVAFGKKIIVALISIQLSDDIHVLIKHRCSKLL